MIRAILISLLLAAAAAGQEFRVISDPFDAGNVSITGGSIDGVTLGAASVTINDNVTLYGDAADVLAIRDGANPQSLSIYNTYTDASNYELAELGWTSNTFYVQAGAAGTGTQRSIVIDGATVALRAGGATKFQFYTGENVSHQRLRASVDATTDLGSSVFHWRDLFLDRQLVFSDGSEIVANGDGGLTVRTAADVATLSVDSSGNVTPGGAIYRTVTAGITASTTQTQGQGALTAWLNEVATVANANDTVTLPTAVAGMEVVICNNGANTLQIFPASGDNLGAGLNTATTLAAGSNVTYVSYDATNWEVK